MRRILVVVLLILLVTACSPFSSSKDSAAINKENSSPEILADCFLSFNLSAWNDLDADGVWDESELPLEGIEFHINGLFAAIVSEQPCISDEEGKCSIGTWAPGECLAGNFTITATIPEDYEATTPTEITLALTPADYSAKAQFGFYGKE